MTGFVEQIIGFVADHRVWAYGLAFALAMAEALPVVGTLVPGSLIVIGLGGLVPGGTLELWPLVIGATLGAITGDGLSYGLGRRYHQDIVRIWPFRRYPGLIVRAEALFQTHGGKAVFACRFVQGPRAFVPLAAGILTMPAARFFAVNILSALVWAPSHILLGALLGGSLLVAGAVAGRLAVLAVLAFALGWLVFWLARAAFRVLPDVLLRLQVRALAWARAGSSWRHREVAALLDPDRRETQPLVFFALLLVVAAWLFLGVLEDVVSGDPLVFLDRAVYHFLQGLRTEGADRLLIVVTELGDSAVVVSLGGAVLVWLALRRAWRASAYWVGGLVFASGFSSLLKNLLHVPRPVAIYSGWSTYGFPSGHSLMGVVLWGFLALLIARETRPKYWPWIYGASALWVLLIAFSRLYLGAHWLSDVLGGLAFGAAWLALLSIAYLRHRPPKIGARPLAAIVGVVLVVAGAAHVQARYERDIARYAVRTQSLVLSAADWQAGDWRRLPARRADLEGDDKEPLVLQWAGPPDVLEAMLARHGWRRPAPWSVKNALSWLNPQPDARTLPVLAKLHAGRLPALTLILPQPGAPPGAFRLVLRLWESDVRIVASGRARRLWLGSVVAERLSRPAGLVAITRSLAETDGPLARLRAALPAALTLSRADHARRGWSGEVLLGGAPKTAGEAGR